MGASGNNQVVIVSLDLLVVHHLCFALHQIAGINLIGENFMDHAGAPHGIVIHSGGNRQTLYTAVSRGLGMPCSFRYIEMPFLEVPSRSIL